MPPGTLNEMAAQFIAAYQAIKDKKVTERLLALVGPQILSAKADGISDKESIELINSLGLREKFYPAKLKELRGRLAKSEVDASANEGDDPVTTEDIQPLAAALSAHRDGATA
ncbi:hypothetical protein [Xanthomonas floridensis]|uniref:Uncharacterized protein n=1 Tax=Xanthomonas floridensis TaxID=1843580 RepID=A0A1A9M9F6_9XANT|nr:hypothetical protein [Xanthomonas floridensis]MEA5122318.1 hypothetical protein [Xanthomonas floridensis]MEA5133644.1 hypothetical protein [Xanthomonas floridensis]OAG66925.1 hypothetical protein A7D17_04195 [Xanthomonas floridensis]